MNEGAVENDAEGSKTKWGRAETQAVAHTAYSPLPTLPGVPHTSYEVLTMTDLLHIENMYCSTDTSQNNFFASQIQP